MFTTDSNSYWQREQPALPLCCLVFSIDLPTYFFVNSSLLLLFLTRGKSLVSQKIQKNMKSVWQWTLLWPVIINKTIMEQNRVESLHRNGDLLEQKRRSSNISGRLRQSPAQLAQELKSISVDWATRVTPPQSGQNHPVTRVQHTWQPYEMPPTLLQRLPREMKLSGRSQQ